MHHPHVMLLTRGENGGIMKRRLYTIKATLDLVLLRLGMVMETLAVSADLILLSILPYPGLWP